MADDPTTSNVSKQDEEETEEGLFPVPNSWFTVAVYLMLLVWMSYIVFESLGYIRNEDWLFPLIIGAPVILMILARLLTITRPALTERITPDWGTSDGKQMFSEGSEASNRSKAQREKYELFMLAWVILLPFMMFGIGMGWTVILYTFGFTWFFTRSVRDAALVTGVVIVFVWILFIEILQVVIWGGLFDIPGPLRLLVQVRQDL